MGDHWINTFIGLPWAMGTKGPDTFDCFGLVQVVMRDHYGIVVPDVSIDFGELLQICRAIRKHEGWLEWQRVERPLDGALVKLIKQTEPDHIGVWIDVDGGGILHASRACGVVFDTPFTLRALGWSKLEYYHYRGRHA